MNQLTLAALAAMTTLALAGAANAQEVRALASGAEPAKASLADLKNISGNWAGPQSVAAFTVSPNGEIVGHLEIGSGSAPRVEELWIFRPDNGSILVSQKHFGPALEPREDKDTWAHRKLVAVDPGHIYLENLTWITDGDTLTLEPKGDVVDLAVNRPIGMLKIEYERSK